MPAHKYYCDYCDKQFYDTPASRKRHLQGISHQRAKKQWFDSFKDQESGLPQDVKRPPCAFFLRTGTCQYGSACRFEHPARHPIPPAPATLEALNAPESSALANFLMKDLPLSLRPPPEGGYPPAALLDWGHFEIMFHVGCCINCSFCRTNGEFSRTNTRIMYYDCPHPRWQVP